MARRLNKMNIGFDYNIDRIDLLKRTEVFHSEIVCKRGDELERIAFETKQRLSNLRTTTASVDGVILENNDLIKKVADFSSDDVAGARSVINTQGVKSNVPGITSSLFTNPGSFGGNLPALNAMLKKIKNRSSA